MEFIKERYNVLINTYLGVKFITNQILGYCKYGKNNLKVIFEIDIFFLEGSTGWGGFVGYIVRTETTDYEGNGLRVEEATIMGQLLEMRRGGGYAPRLFSY